MSAPQSAEGMEPSTEQDFESANGTPSGPDFLRPLLKHANGLAVGALTLLILLFFFKTCFLGGSISRLCVLAEWDSVFDAWRTGKIQPYDPSLVQIFCPDYFFLAQNLSKGILPLWNPHCGLGYPFLADIQSSVFAPLRLIFDLFPNQHTYNYYLIFELIACSVSSFFLGRALGLGLICSVFAAIAYTFCPYNMWYMEMNLGPSSCLFPLTALAFVHAAKQKTVGSGILAGLSSALLITSGHPECSFFGITLSSALMFILLVLRGGKQHLLKSLLTSIKLLFIAAFSTVAVSAPALLPFAEYLMNGESYKYGSTYSTPVTVNGIFFNLCNPGQNGASPYLGIIAAVLIPFSLFALRKSNKERLNAISLMLMTSMTFILVSQFGPIQAIFSKPPFTAIITRYALPYLLLLIALLSAAGLEELRKTCEKSRLPQKFSCVSLLLILPAFYAIFAYNMSLDSGWMKSADFDAMLPRTAFNVSALKRDITCTSIFAFMYLASILEPAFVPKQLLRKGIILVLAGLILSFISEGSIARFSLPQQSKFFYPETELIQKLKDEQYRSISTCEYVLRPATNAVYGVNFLTVHNPLFPKRFLEFSKACGAKTDVFNQTFGTKLSPLLDLASVKYILSLEPVSAAWERKHPGNLDEDPSTHGSQQQQEHETFPQVYKSKNNISIYENKNAAPRAYIVSNAIYCKGATEALASISAPEFEPRSSVVIESSGEPSSSRTLPEDHAQATQYTPVEKFQSIDSNAVSITCKSEGPSWLVLTDIYYPGWNAYIDGKKTTIERANYAFRSVKLDAGTHVVDFKYEPMSFTIGLGLLALFAFIAGWSAKSKRWDYKL